MTQHTDKPSARIELELVPREQSQILANLLELYAHDFSEFQTLAMGTDGRFGHKSLHCIGVKLTDIPSLSGSMAN